MSTRRGWLAPPGVSLEVGQVIGGEGGPRKALFSMKEKRAAGLY